MKMHHCETNLKILGGALPPIPLPLGARGTRSCPLCPTHFLVSSGAYVRCPHIL